MSFGLQELYSQHSDSSDSCFATPAVGVIFILLSHMYLDSHFVLVYITTYLFYLNIHNRNSARRYKNIVIDSRPSNFSYIRGFEYGDFLNQAVSAEHSLTTDMSGYWAAEKLTKGVIWAMYPQLCFHDLTCLKLLLTARQSKLQGEFQMENNFRANNHHSYSDYRRISCLSIHFIPIIKMLRETFNLERRV